MGPRNKRLVYKSLILGTVICLSAVIAIGEALTLTSVKVGTAPAIDGIPDPIWDQSDALSFDVTGGANTESHTVILNSVYTDDSVYFLAQWEDPSESLRFMPWVKRSQDAWEQLRTPNVIHGGENTYYEDKFAHMWNINIAGFESKGCSATCHEGENLDVKDFGNKYTQNPGELGDIWDMKMVRTNPTGYIDDQYVDSTRYNAETAPEAGIYNDPGNSPYYENGKTDFISPSQPAGINRIYWIYDDEKESFADTYKIGDEIASIIVRQPSGDRADIRGKAIYNKMDT